MKSESRIAELFECYRPEWSVQTISDSAGMPARYLQSWVTPEATGRPIAPPPKTVLLRLAAALGADVTTVQQAFTAVWSTLNGGCWNHFAPGDRVVVFGEPDPATGSRRVRRGTVLDPLSPDLIRIDFGGEGHGEFSPANPVRVCHVAGTCQCVVKISSRKPFPATSDGQGQARWA
ncbi:hypothetical protein [Amycolatopsis sp. NBC_01286]|uniref:hypothetical protein n=1 Tax=Amycolatopsis sp. NBC_01286 TaxID=2903560 RepID=UPI002E0E276F|nr:hypothetical protein OG570_32115 [Amycolatopsis sp. NBC_01286]